MKAEPLTFEIDSNIWMIGLEGSLKKASKRVKITVGRLSIATLTNVIAHPLYTALFDAQGNIIPDSSMYVMPFNAPSDVKEKYSQAHQRFEPETISVSELATSDEVVVFGGASHSHFGHHLLDGMSRLWHHSGHKTLCLDAHPRIIGFNSFISEYRSLGRPRRFFDLQRPTLFKRVLMPHAAIQNGFRAYGNADAEHLEIASTALHRARRPFAAKIYLSRSNIEKRKCEGESELESALSRFGFEVVCPEKLSIVDQVSLFNRADWIVGTIGSAFHNVLFTLRGASIRTVQFTWDKPNLRYTMIDRIKGHPSYYAKTMDAEVARGVVVSTRIDVEKSLAVLRMIGALEPDPTLVTGNRHAKLADAKLELEARRKLQQEMARELEAGRKREQEMARELQAGREREQEMTRELQAGRKRHMEMTRQIDDITWVISKLRSENKASRERRKEIANVVDNRNAKIAELKADRDAKIAKLKADHDAKIAKLKAELQARYDELAALRRHIERSTLSSKAKRLVRPITKLLR